MLRYIKKEDIPKTLRGFIDYDFNYGTWDKEKGPTIEGRSFCKKFINAIKKKFPDCEVNLKPSYWYISGYIKNKNEKLVYVSISDVRYERSNDWAERILIRKMAHEKDWVGGPNHYTNLRDIVNDVNFLF